MEHSKRFTDAVTKLYNAFHNGELNAMDPCCCAVGNICDNSAAWSAFNPNSNERNLFVSKTGYSLQEIFMIESIFMFGKDGDGDAQEVRQPDNNDVVFKALCEVVEYLCELEGIPNVMDYSRLFETENDAPKHQLEEVFVK